MAKRNHPTRRQRQQGQQRQQKRAHEEMALIDTVQNRTWLAAYPKWRFEATKLDFLPLEMLIEIFLFLDPVDAYAFVKANYPRLESVWKCYGPCKIHSHHDIAGLDSQVALVSREPGFCPQWFWSPTAWASNGYDCRSGTLYYNTYVLASSFASTLGIARPLKTIAEAPETKPQQSPVWQDRLTFWLDQILVQHMQRCHAGRDTAVDLTRCLYTCTSISVFSTRAQVYPKEHHHHHHHHHHTGGEGEEEEIEEERWMDTWCTPHRPSAWPDSKYVAINLDSGYRAYDCQFRDGNGEHNEYLLLTHDDVKTLVKNRQVHALQEQFEWNETPFDGTMRDEVFGRSRVLWDRYGGLASDEEEACRMWREEQAGRLDREAGLTGRGLKLNWFLGAGWSLGRKLEKKEKEKEEMEIESQVGRKDNRGEGEGERRTLLGGSTSKPAVREMENSHQCRGHTDSLGRDRTS